MVLPDAWPLLPPARHRPLPAPTANSGPRTVVVFIRPPGCVHVQPDRLMSRSQPSPSRQGSMSHHCLVLMMRAAERGRTQQSACCPPAHTDGLEGLSPGTGSQHWTSPEALGSSWCGLICQVQ